LRLLFDHGVPSPLRRFLTRHDVTFARQRGWGEHVNGRLIAAAAEAGFEGIVTCDKNWSYQQNLKARLLAFAVLPTNIWPDLRPHVADIVAFIDGMEQGTYRELHLPRPTLKRRPAPERSE
jgi:hypothetical protein